MGENAEEVRARFREVAELGPERLVVIAHSRGACDALAFALQNPRFVRDRIHALFLVQGPFGGTGVADYVAGEAPPMDRRLPLRFRAVTQVLGGLEARALKRGKHGGLAEMTRQASQDFWEQTLEEHADAIPIVGPKTFYVTTETAPSRLRLFKRATASYLRTFSGPNDGMVALDDQSLPDVGTVLAVLDAGHTDLTNKYPSARATQQLRKALIQGVVMAVGRPEDEPALAARPAAPTDDDRGDERRVGMGRRRAGRGSR
jgi:pimeloyl-ACP methyl ester carboxylesterase